MPGERLTVRSPADIGRFPGTAPPTRVELTIHKEEDKKPEEGGCRRWFKKMCPCCFKRQASTSYDVTDKVELVKPPTPAPIPEPEKITSEKEEMKEMEGRSQGWKCSGESKFYSLWHTLCLSQLHTQMRRPVCTFQHLYSHFCHNIS